MAVSKSELFILSGDKFGRLVFYSSELFYFEVNFQFSLLADSSCVPVPMSSLECHMRSDAKILTILFMFNEELTSALTLSSARVSLPSHPRK